MSDHKKQQSAYDDRYQRLYAAGALNWNSPVPNPHLTRLLKRFRARHKNCIEFGCGEGYQARLMASRDYSVTAVDLSPTVIARAIQNTPAELGIKYIVGDVTDAGSLHLEKKSYDLAVDIGCLHLLTDDGDRSQYLELVHDLLKPGGKLFLQNGLDLADVKTESEFEARQLAELQQLMNRPAGYPVPRKIITANGECEITLPLCPCTMLSLDGYIRELTRHSFKVLAAQYERGVNCLYEAVIVAELS